MNVKKNLLLVCLAVLCLATYGAPAGADLLGPQNLAKGGSWVGGIGSGKKGKIEWAVEDEGEKYIKIIGQEEGAVGHIALKNFVPVEPGMRLYFDYKGKYSAEPAHVQIRFYNDKKKEIGQYVVETKAAVNQWFTLSEAGCKALFMGMDENGTYKRGRRVSYKNINSFIVPPDAAMCKVLFYAKGVASMAVKDVVLLRENLTAEEKEVQEEQERLLLKLSGEKKSGPKERTPGFKVSSDEVELAPVNKPLPSGWPVPKVEARKGVFYLNGTPSYLTGVETEATLTPFWYKLLGLDFIEHITVYSYSTSKVDLKPDSIHFKWAKPYADLTLGVREMLKNGFLPYVHMIEGAPGRLHAYYKLKDNAPDLLVDFGHFYGLRHDNADAWMIRRNFIKNTLSALTDYPIFAIETYNEVLFIDGGPEAVKRFRAWCEKKYGTIVRLNEVWKTQLASFDAITPPPVSGWTYSFTTVPRNISRMMWRDWVVFSSLNSQEAFRKTYDLVKEYRPDTMVTVQSHAAFFYDHIFCGISAETKSKAEDIYGDESIIRYSTMPAGKEDPQKISLMLRGVLWIDYLANLLPEQTQMSEECMASSSYIDIGKDLQAVELHDGEWRFIPDNDDLGTQAGYALKDFDDSAWKKITVPGMWAVQGYRDVVQGWYRREIQISGDHLKKDLYLNGKELAAATDIYINGELVHHKTRTTAIVSVKINSYLTKGRNVLVVKLRDNYRDGGYYWGGIRGSISIDLLPQQKPPLNYGQLRSYFWERMLHGESGSVYSYAYMSEGWVKWGMYHPANLEWRALKAFPQVKVEFKNSSDIIMKKKLRLDARIALCYPEETMRYHIAETFSEASKGPLGHDLLTWYSALISSGVPTAVIPNSVLAGERLNDYKVVFMQGNERIPEGTMEKLKKYVENGGILVMDGASLQREDNFDKVIEKSDFAGCVVGKAYSDGNNDKDKMVPRLRDRITGWAVQARTATVMLEDSRKRPVLLCNRFGKGQVYTLAANPNGRALNKIFADLLKTHGQLADVNFMSAESVPWVERYLLGGEGKYVVYLHNWGGGTFDGKVKFNKLPEPGKYTVRNLETGEVLLTDAAMEAIGKNGIPVKLSSQNPVVLLMENSAPRKLEQLSAEQDKWMDYIDRKPLENIPAAKRIMMYSGGVVTYSRIKLLTAAHWLEQNGFECVAGLSTPMAKDMDVYNGGLKTEKLDSYGIVFIGGNRVPFKAEEIKLLEQYVQNGGRLFLCGSWSRTLWLSNASNSKLLQPFGANIMNSSYIDPKNCDDNVELYPIFTTSDAKKLVSHGMAIVRVDDNWKIIAPGTTQCMDMNMVSHPVDKIAGKKQRSVSVAAREYGKGRVVVCGDASWLEGANFDKGDNREIFLNLMKWLSE